MQIFISAWEHHQKSVIEHTQFRENSGHPLRAISPIYLVYTVVLNEFGSIWSTVASICSGTFSLKSNLSLNVEK